MKGSIRKIHENFLEKARIPMLPSPLPIVPVKSDTPIIATERWNKVDGKLVKTFMFRELTMRDEFVRELFEYERKIGHSATIVIKGDKVKLFLVTDGPGHVTELDNEYSKYADELYKDVVYDPFHGQEYLKRL